MDYTTKLSYQSMYWYNDGLKKANIRDLSGAITSLKKSLQYNRANIAARNLLGLVYYGRGDVVEALVEWVLSKNFQSHENIANYYIQKIRETPGELEMINQAIKRYNQALGYCYQNGEDLAIIQLKKAVAAHPDYVKAHQLLALLYMHTEQYGNARQSIRTAHKLDTTDDITLRYMHELNQIRKARTAKLKENEKKEKHTVTYNIGNETIIQPVSSSYKDNAGLHTVVNIALGVVVGVAVMWFLIMPALNSTRQEKVNKQTVEFSDQIATQTAQISALKKELEEYRSTSEETQNAQATAESTQSSYEIVMSIASHYQAKDMSDSAMLEQLLQVNADSLGTVGRETFDGITSELYPRMCEDLYSTSQKNYEVANYETAISNLEQVMKMDEGYSDGGAMLLLAQSYEKSGEQDQANLKYQKILEAYPDTEAAQAAQEALDAQNGEGGQEE
ncbi:tetratricopeptide repeat protein [Bariatricus sp. SGI.154]|uniref:tetratricopeptide repeat protein n=1 Tax=Bariatricus sp. SGI.154 TaxID=3420549 RepID=UPI003CFFAF4C